MLHVWVDLSGLFCNNFFSDGGVKIINFSLGRTGMPDGQGLAAVLEKGEQKKGKKQMCPASVGEKVRDKIEADKAAQPRLLQGVCGCGGCSECRDEGRRLAEFG